MASATNGISLRALAMFEVLARNGSIAETARRTGQSQPAVSQQLQRLEAGLGTPLMHHGTRPMTLTNAGRVFLTRAQESLRQLRLARTELELLDLSHLTRLRIGIIEDFDAEVTPALVSTLSQNLRNCHFKQVSGPSHELGAKLDDRSLDLIVAAAGTDPVPGWHELALLRDPYILATPLDFTFDPGDPLPALRDLPFLRQDRDMLMGRQIEAQLARLRIDLTDRFEIGSIQSLMGLVANGFGWTITTPLGYVRARRFQDQIAVHPLPFAKFSRHISLFWRADGAGKVPGDIAKILRALLQQSVVAEGLETMPWLQSEYRVIG